MSALSGLKMVIAKRVAVQSPAMHRRTKLCSKLNEQMELAKAQSEGRLYAPMKFKTVTDAASGERRSIETAKRVKQWWWDAGGKVNLSVRYGAKVIELAKGKNAIELATVADLLPTLQLIKQAVEAGELDTQIEAVSNKLRSGFGK
jgi:hypothetical protein